MCLTPRLKVPVISISRRQLTLFMSFLDRGYEVSCPRVLPRKTRRNMCASNPRPRGPYSPTILKNLLCLVLQICQYLAAFECKTTSEVVLYSNLHNLGEKDKRMFMRMFGGYGPWITSQILYH